MPVVAVLSALLRRLPVVLALAVVRRTLPVVLALAVALVELSLAPLAAPARDVVCHSE